MEESQDVTVPADPETFDRGALETEVSAKMADIFKDGDDEIAEPVEKPAEEKAEPTTEAEPAEPAEAAKDQPAEEPSTAPTAASPLPAAYRRSLKAYQWTDQEIDAALKANPDGFLKTAEKMHLTRVEETRRWADLGRKSKETPAPAAEPAKLSKFDAKALREKYGDEPFIAAMEAQAAQLEAASHFITQAQAREQAAAMASLGKQVDGFFSGKELEPYADHYGKAGATLTDKQLTARQQVLETADLLISGARAMGRPITLDEALQTAHDSVSSPIAAKAAVKKVQQQVQARQQSLSLRPGARAASPKTGNERKALEGVVKKGLAAAFK